MYYCTDMNSALFNGHKNPQTIINSKKIKMLDNKPVFVFLAYFVTYFQRQ